MEFSSLYQLTGYIIVIIPLTIIHVVGRSRINNRALPRGMEIYHEKLDRIPYYEHLEIVHLFDIIRIGKNVAATLW